MNNFSYSELDFFLVYYPLPNEVIETFVDLDLKFPDIFTVQPGGKRMYISLQNFKNFPFYNENLIHELKYNIASTIGLRFNDYVEVRDSIGVNYPGVGIAPHVDIVEDIHVNFKNTNAHKQKIYTDWLQTNDNLGEGKNSNFVQMRCNLFVVEPRNGQDAWVNDKVLQIPRGGYGAVFNSGKLHGTTPGSDKKITISLGFLLRLDTFRDLVFKNHKQTTNIYSDKKYMLGLYPS